MDKIILEWDVYKERCPSRAVMGRISDKWVMLLLGIVGAGPVRFNEIKRKIEGISQKSLTETLRTLERDGLVDRTVIATSPVAVKYSITALGRTLADATEMLRLWTETHMEEVLAAQERFDAR